MSVTAFVEIYVKEEYVSAMAEGAKVGIEACMAFGGCENITPLRDLSDPCHLMYVETWVSRDRHQEYHQMRVARGDVAAEREMLTQPMRIQYFESLA